MRFGDWRCCEREGEQRAAGSRQRAAVGRVGDVDGRWQYRSTQHAAHSGTTGHDVPVTVADRGRQLAKAGGRQLRAVAKRQSKGARQRAAACFGARPSPALEVGSDVKGWAPGLDACCSTTLGYISIAGPHAHSLRQGGPDLISSQRARPFARAVFAISRCILLAVTAADRTWTLVRARQISPFYNARTTPVNMVPIVSILYPSTFTVFFCCSRGATTLAASAIRPARRGHDCPLHSAAANDITAYCTIANCQSCAILLNPAASLATLRLHFQSPPPCPPHPGCYRGKQTGLFVTLGINLPTPQRPRSSFPVCAGARLISDRICFSPRSSARFSSPSCQWGAKEALSVCICLAHT